MKFLEKRLQEWEGQGLRRKMAVRSNAPGRTIVRNGRTLLNFASNDYLGLADDVGLRSAELSPLGIGAGASRLVTGNCIAHESLESELAGFHAMPSALVFPSGFQANLGLLSSLGQKEDRIFSDERNHASIIDGCRLSRAESVVYPHLDLERLEKALGEPVSGERFVVSESVFSMDGDVAPVVRLRELCDRAGAHLIMDEAHAVGVLGNGRGLCAEEGVAPDALVGGLGKAFGTGGGYVCGPVLLREFLYNRARSFVFSTGIAPILSEAARRSLAVIQGPDGEARRAKLAELVGALAGGLDQLGELAEGAGRFPIFPVLVGTPERAIAAQEALLRRGILCPAIRPPTVAQGQSRLRVSLSASHELRDVQCLLDALPHALKAS